jgi:hypothetical protein
VIHTVQIRGLRGIREGTLSELTPLVVLVGPNACGKSTVLEALLIGASDTPNDAVGKCVQRRSGVWNGVRWLLTAPPGEPWQVRVVSEKHERATQLQVVPYGTNLAVMMTLSSPARGHGAGRIELAADNTFVAGDHPMPPELKLAADVRLVEPRPDVTQTPLHRVYSAAVQNGLRAAAESFIPDVLPGFIRLEILTAPNSDEPEVNVVFESGALPVPLVGDGAQALIRQCLELAALKDGLALLEEPEAFKHPRAIRQSALAMVAAAKRGVQVILTTHSLELIDALVAASDDAALESLSLYRLALHDGKLASTRLVGREVKLMRSQIEEDLR